WAGTAPGSASSAARRLHRRCISAESGARYAPLQSRHRLHPACRLWRYWAAAMLVRPGETAARRLTYLFQVVAAMVLFCASAQARTAHIALTVSGDETMSKDLQQIVEQFQKDQPLSGDSLSLLQGAQAALARVNTALRSRGFYDA